MKQVRQGKRWLEFFCVLIVFIGLLLFPVAQTVVWAGNKAVENSESTKEIRSQIDEDLLEDVEWVEVVIEKNGKAVSNPLWFSIWDDEWYVPIKDLSDGNYQIQIYEVTDNEEEHLDDDSSIADLKFSINRKKEISYSSFKAKETAQKITGKPAISVRLNKLKFADKIVKVQFAFTNSKGKLIYTKTALEEKKGIYTAEVSAKKLNNVAGTYTIKAIAIDENGKKYEIKEKVKAKLHVANATVKGGKPDRKAGTFIFKTSRIMAISPIESVKMRIWCKNSDKKSYSDLKRNSDGSYQTIVDASKHLYHFGTYHVEVIVFLKDGSKEVVASNKYYFEPKNFVRFDKVTQKNKKTIRIYYPTEKDNMLADVWSKSSDGKDKVTYGVSGKGNVLKLVIDMKKLTHSGTVYVQFKQKTASGYKNFKKYSFQATANDISKHGWFYEKAGDGKLYKYYYSKGKKVKNLTNVLDIKNEKLYIKVNRKMNTVTVYAKDKATGQWNVPVIAFACSVGLSGTPTPTGTFTTDRNHRWKELMGPSWGQYCTHVVRGVYFHSVAGRNTTSYNLNAYSYNRLGSAASHGCIRLCVRDAKWIYDHCAIGSTVYIYDGNSSGPLGKPETIKIPIGQTWDPTDPAIKQ